MDGLDILINSIDEALNTKRKRHIVGGVLLSVSMLLSGLALTIVTIKSEE